MAQTVAELLGGQPTQAPSDAGPPPPGFIVANDIPPPPPGFSVQSGAKAAPARTAADLIGMGVRGVATGAGSLVDILAGPANATVNAATGSHLSTSPMRDLAASLADAGGLATPQTNQEKLGNAIVEGGTQGLATAGAGMAASGARGAGGVVARALASSPVLDTAASASATGSQEVARQNGAGPLGQLAAGVVGAVGGVAGVKAAEGSVASLLEKLGAKYGTKAVKLATDVPREALIDEKGALTDEGKDVAAHNDLHPDQLKGVYDDAARVQEAVAAEPAPVGDAAPVAEAPAAPPQATPAAVEAAPVAEAPATSFEPANDAPLPASATDRVAQAQSEGVPLTRGQATQDFATQEKEQTLLGQPSAEGNAARQFFQGQQDKIAAAVDRFKAAFGDTTATAADRGQLVKDALTQLRDSGKAGVTALYTQARDIAEGMGSAGSNLINLDTTPLLARIKQVLIDEGVDPKVRSALRQQAAQYGLMGQGQRVFEDGSATVRLVGHDGEPGPTIQLQRPQEPLTIVNAEKLRQFINEQFRDDKTAALQGLKPILDNAVQSAVERAAAEGTGDVGQAFRAARAAHVTQQQTFKAKDVVQKLIDWKVRDVTPTVLPENAIKTIFSGGKEAISDLKKVKALLLSKPTDASRAAWQAIQAHGVAQIFDKAVTINANHGGGALGAISGAKLNTAIAKFGADKLKVLLPESDFNALMKLRRIIGDATIPISRTVNHSNTAQKVIQFLAGQAGKLAMIPAHLVPGLPTVIHGAGALAKLGKESALSKSTLEGIESFTPEAAAKTEAKVDQLSWARRFLDLAASDQILAPVIATAANEQRP